VYEVENGSTFLGKPYEPNSVIKNDIEFILMERKPGGYRKPDVTTRTLNRVWPDGAGRLLQATGRAAWLIPPGEAVGPARRGREVPRRHRRSQVASHTESRGTIVSCRVGGARRNPPGTGGLR